MSRGERAVSLLAARLWIEREISASADGAWNLLTDVERWPEWGPSVRAAALDGGAFAQGATGWVQTPLRARLRFEITSVEVGRGWSWKVAGLPATGHRVRSLAPTTCAVGFGVPRIAAPYALVCRRALTRIERLLAADD